MAISMDDYQHGWLSSWRTISMDDYLHGELLAWMAIGMDDHLQDIDTADYQHG